MLKYRTRLSLLLITLSFAPLVSATEVQKPAAPVIDVSTEIVSAEFGTFDIGRPDELLFSPTDQIPRKAGQRYGWVIELRTNRRSLLVREEYLLPNKPPVYPVREGTVQDDALTVTHARRHQVSERRLVPVDGRIIGEWAIGPDEPAGTRSLLVVIEGAPDTRFDYRVE